MIEKIIIGAVAATVVMFAVAWTMCRAAEKGDRAQGIGAPAFDPIRDRIRHLRKHASGTRS
ncbi:MAG TPA: hypothetical protein VGM50_23100 [Gemmatimonadaceae bacterium]|jgi:hypothetical protein